MASYNPFRSRAAADELRAKGDEARDRRQWSAAAELYQRYLESQPNDAAIWVQLGHCRKESGERDTAERAYLRALSIEPGNPDTLVQLGHIEKLNGRLEQALAWYRKALAFDATFAPALHEVEQISSAAAGSGMEMGPSGTNPEAVIAAAVDERVRPLADQISAIKAIALELQRVRRRAEASEERLTELGSSLEALEGALSALKAEHAARLAELEAKAPVGQYKFPALLEQIAEARAQRSELDQFRSKIDTLLRRLNGPTS